MLEYLIIAIASLAAGFIGTSVGGGSLLSTPLLIIMGIPAQVAVATNRVGTFGVTLFGLHVFHKKKQVVYKVGIPVGILAFIGAGLGAYTLTRLSNDVVQKIVGVLMLTVVFVLFANKNSGLTPKKTSKALHILGYPVFFLVGFMGGVLGGGGSVFSTVFLVMLYGTTFIQAAATKKLIGLGINSISIPLFIYFGLVEWNFAIIMFFCMGLGSHLGAKYAIKKGNAWVRRLFAVLVVILAIKMLV